MTMVTSDVFAAGVVGNPTEADLRAALAGGGTMTFACDGRITLASTLTITNDTTLDGTGHSVILSGGGAVRVLWVNSGVRLALKNLTIADGVDAGWNGGGLFNSGGRIEVSSCIFSNNFAGTTPSAPCFGGAVWIASGSSFSINDSTFVRNGASTFGGALSAGHGELSGSNSGGGITNCTFYENRSIAVAILGRMTKPVTIVNSTFAWNTNGAVRFDVYQPTFPGLTVINTIAADSLSGDNFRRVVDAGHNLSTDASLTNATSLVNTDPLLGPLGDYGGPTPTMPLLTGSPAIDAADNAAAPAIDQRGVTRPIGLSSDIGAFEGQANPSYPSAVRFTRTNYPLGESQSTATVQVERTGSSVGQVGVSFVAASGSATAGEDFIATNINLAFASGEMQKTVSVGLLGDATPEGDETVLLSLVNPVGTVLDTPSTATLTIVDDDQGQILTNCTEAALRSAISNGGYILLSCDGTLTLSSPITISQYVVLDASGHDVTLSGGDAVRQFNVTPGGALTLKNLTLANGRAVGVGGGFAYGGAVSVDHGTLSFIGCRLWTNAAVGGDGNPGGQASGGAVHLVGGVFNATNSLFLGNRAQGGAGVEAGGGNAWGGVVYASDSLLNLDGCRFTGNAVQGGSPAGTLMTRVTSGAARGEVSYHDGGTTIVARCSFELNSGSSPQPVSIYDSSELAQGGVIHNAAGRVAIGQTTFTANCVAGGSARRYNGSAGPGQGGAIYSLDVIELTACRLDENSAFGGSFGCPGANGEGGGIYNAGQMRIAQSQLNRNSAMAGSGHNGGMASCQNGAAGGGAVFSRGQLEISASTLSGNSVNGAPGDWNANGVYVPGSHDFGGAIFNSGVCTLTNLTFAGNAAQGGKGGTIWGVRAGGDGYGGAVFSTNGMLALVNATLSGNAAIGGAGLPSGLSAGGGIASTNSTVQLLNTILADSPSGSNAFGTLTDLGHNISSDASCAFSGAGSLNNTDPRLGPLGNYGGPTPTMPLLAGSPAIDGGASAGAPATDQRGRARPFGVTVDVGAFESSPPYAILGRISGATLEDEVTVSWSGTTTETSGGDYSLFVAAGSAAVTPLHPDYVFRPANRSITVGPDQPGVDFQAYHRNALSLDETTNQMLRVVYAGTNGRTYRVLASTNLDEWRPFSTNTAGADDTFECLLPVSGSPAQFYRIVTP